MSAIDEIVAREERHVLKTYQRYPIAISRGKGVFVYDLEGKRYLDFVGGLGVNALGHAHPRIVKAIREQAAWVIHTSNLYYHEYQGPLAEKLCRLSGLGRVFFSNSGTEAMEGALKVARAAGHARGGDSKCGIVAMQGSYHGRSFGALSVTGQARHQQGFEPMLPGVKFVRQNDVEGLRAAVNDDVCAIVLEPIQGEGGIHECSEEFLKEARLAADRHAATLIFDEIQCGLGRTGDWFAFQTFGVAPDVVAIAKPIAGGIPLGAFLVREELAGVIAVGKHGTTFGGGPLACRAGIEYLAAIEEDNLLENVRRVGAYLKQELAEIARKFSVAKETRGRGLIQALELTAPARPLVVQALEDGVLFNQTQDVVLRFLPPFLLQEKHVDKGIRVLKKLLRAAV